MKTSTRIFLITAMLLALCLPAHAESIYQLTNNSGGAVASGALVVIDTTATDSFTTSTASYDDGMWGVVPFRRNGDSISIANGSRGPIQVSGVVQIICDEAIAIGDFISTSTSVAGQGTADTGQPERFIGRALEADAGAPFDPTVLIIPHTSSNFDINFTAPATPGSEFDIVQVNIDISSLDDDSTVHVFDISTTGTSNGVVEGIVTHGGNISPIHQHIGTFVTPSQTEFAGEIPSGGSWSDGLDGNTIFEADDDEIYLGSTGVFDSMEVILSTPSSQAQFAVYEFLNDSAAWVAFVPGDTTNDWQDNGIISWESDGFTDWDPAGDPGGGDASSGYWIRVRRERPVVITDPVVTTIKILDPTEYEWDPLGDITARGIIAQDATSKFQDDGDTTKTLQFQLSGITTATNRTVRIQDLDGVIPSVGTAFPANPAEGDLFYHSTHEILFQHEGALWAPIISYAALSLFVDAGSGSDAIGQGFGSGASATATVQYCIDNCIPAIFGGGDVTITITAANYAEDVVIKGKMANGDFVIIPTGTLSESVAEATVDSGVQGTGATRGNIVDAAPAWADDAHNGLFIQFEDDTTTAALQGDIHVVDATTDAGDLLEIVGTFDAQPVAGDTYTIQTWGTTFDSLSLGDGQKAIELTKIHLDDEGGFTLAGVHAALQMTYCKTSDSVASAYFIDKFSSVRADFCVFDNVRTKSSQGFLRMADSRHIGGQGGACVESANLNQLVLANGTVIDADSDDVDAVKLSINSIGEFFTPAASGYLRIRNADQAGRSGILTEKGSGANNTVNIQFLNNTANETTDGDSWSN